MTQKSYAVMKQFQDAEKSLMAELNKVSSAGASFQGVISDLLFNREALKGDSYGFRCIYTWICIDVCRFPLSL